MCSSAMDLEMEVSPDVVSSEMKVVHAMTAPRQKKEEEAPCMRHARKKEWKNTMQNQQEKYGAGWFIAKIGKPKSKQKKLPCSGRIDVKFEH